MTGLTRRRFFPAALAVGLGGAAGPLDRVFGAGGPVKVRLGTLAPRGSSYTKHLLAMGEQWRQAPGGGVLLTIYPDGTMGSEADMVRRMRLGQLQAGMLTAMGLAEIEPAVTGLQYLPMMFRSLEEVDYIGERLQPMLDKRLEEKGFVVLFWADTGWVRFFSKQPLIRPDDLKKTKLFVGAGRPADLESYRAVGCNSVPLETVDILPGLQTGLINAVPLPPSIALAGQVDRAASNMLDLDWAPLVGAAVMTKKTWDTIPLEGREVLRKAATETGKLMKADGRRESVESVEAMRKRGLTVHAVTPEVEAEWRQVVEAAYPKIRGVIVPEDMFDEVVKQLNAYRAARAEVKEMNGEDRSDAPGSVPLAPADEGWRRWLRDVENLLVPLALAALVLLPLVEIVLRKLFRTGISGATTFQQHLTLIIGLLGGALAAREGRLLTLSTLMDLLKGQARAFARVFSSAFAAGISVFLCVAAAQLVQTEKEAGKILAYGIPLWTIQLVMPLSFGVIALRLLWGAAEGWRGRLVALLLAGGVVWTGLQPPIAADLLVLPALLTLLLAVILGAPIFVLLGGAALILFWGQDLPIASISLTHYSMVTNPTLPTVPLFTLAGYFLAEGGASKRLIRVFQALLGQFRGGPAIVTVLACAFFTSFTGASGVTILALGGLLMPVLMSAGYSERSTLGLLTGSGGLGLLFPPSLPLILYAIVASLNKAGGVTIEKMFLGGLGPGVLLVAMAAWLGTRLGPKEKAGRPAFDRVEAGRAIWAAKWELLLPVVALVALFGGLATPVEAAAVTALYAFVVEAFVYHDFKQAREIPRVMADCGLLVGGVLLILGVALGFSNYLIDAQIPTLAAEWVTTAVKSKYAFLLAVNLCLLVVGCVMDIYSAIVVVVPLIVPLGLAYGIDPIHLGIIFLANMELGLLTPTVGINIFLSSYRFGKPVLQISRAVIPMQCILVAGVLLITYLPPLTTFLPRWLGR